MTWVLVSLLGLVVETGVIVVLGRQVTRRYEAEAPTGVAAARGPAGEDVAARRAA
jgi:hypothetical protein